jgi:membrane-associated phospholipid phosphatase
MDLISYKNHSIRVTSLCIAFLIFQSYLFSFHALYFFSYLPWLVFSVLLTLQFKNSSLFVRDFSIFALSMLFFNFLRGGLSVLQEAYDLPIYHQYVIDFEKWFIASGTLSHLLQSHLWHPGQISMLDRLCIFIYSSHFAFFIMAALLIWLKRKEECWRYRSSFIACCFIGLVLYALVPTVPPWMASHQHFIPPVENIFHTIMQVKFGELIKLVDTNPIAAMPSLHVAFPFIVFLAVTYHFHIKRSWPVFIYFLLVVFSTLYLGAHYLADIFAGMLIAAICYYFFYHVRPPKTYSTTASTAELFIIAVQVVIFLLLQCMIKFTVFTLIGKT